jgi:hypothetical protein
MRLNEAEVRLPGSQRYVLQGDKENAVEVDPEGRTCVSPTTAGHILEGGKYRL